MNPIKEASLQKEEYTMTQTKALIHQTEQYGAANYHPLPIVISEAEGVWVTDPEGNRYMDMLSAYSAVNQGHRHSRIIEALKTQADRVTLTSGPSIMISLVLGMRRFAN